jgi:hypothetical protein
MPQQCLFCPNPVDSAEHIFSDWILKDLKAATSIRVTIGRHSAWVKNPNVKVKCVCATCNNGWMSRVEESNKFAIRAMINDDPCGLTKRDQEKLSRWAMLKAMVLDYCNPKRALFYTQTERESLKNSSSGIPDRTLVWMGRFSRKGFHVGGTDTLGEIEEIPKAGHGCVTTIVVGHLVMQVLTFHVIGQFASQQVNIGCKMGNWRSNLLDIWPSTSLLRWPPDILFTERGSDSIVTLINRWKIGEDVG